jgi:hypothetical protein
MTTKPAAYQPTYLKSERQWCLWNGKTGGEIRDDDGSLRVFLTAQDAFDWLTAHPQGDDNPAR